jgi:hypothetical protein
MPNYTHNFLNVYGTPEELHYFYERNRISKDDAKFMGFGEETPISFEKCVSREITYIIADYINKNYLLKSGTTLEYFNKNAKNNDDSLLLTEDLRSSKRVVDGWDLMVSIWGTKSDAIAADVDLSEIDSDRKLRYRFDTAWCFPENWLITISKMFKNLRFEIRFTNEEDGHDQTYIYQYKEGKKSEIKVFSGIMSCIEEFGGMEKAIDAMIEYCNEENVMITDFSNKKNPQKVHWLTYAKSYIEKDSNQSDYESNLVSYINNKIYTFFDECELHHATYTNKEFCKAFVEKVKNM